MRTIHKYQIDSIANVIEMPLGAKLRHVAAQNGTPTVWAEVNTDAIRVQRKIFVVGTGHSIPDGAKYVGTMFFDIYVLHVYDGGEG